MDAYEHMELFPDYYENLANENYQDYMEYTFYVFLNDLKENCRPPKVYCLPNDFTKITEFWEVA